MNYHLTYPGRIIFGWGARRQLPDHMPKVPYALIAGASQQKHGITDEIASRLGPPACSLIGIPAEPTIHDVDRCLQDVRQAQAQWIVAVGGGSVIDVAKATAVIAPTTGNTLDYFSGDRPITGMGLPVAALPTTAGTGAEITRNAVLTNPDTLIKQSIRHDGMIPPLAIIDPELTVTSPAHVTAASGLDALTQAIESYLSRKANHATMALAIKAVQLIYSSLEKAWQTPTHRPARSCMAEGSMLTAMAFGHSGLGLVHGLAHPIGAILHQPHGLVCAILLPHSLRFNAPVAEMRLKELAQAIGLQTSQDLIQAITDLVSRLQLPIGFKNAGLLPEHYPYILANCRSGSMACNPRDMSDQDILDLLKTLS